MPIFESEYPVPVTGSVFVLNSQGGDVNVTASVPLSVTSTQANPVWVTGVMTVNTGTSGGGLVEITASIPLSVTSTVAAPLWVTGSTGGSSNVEITGSITLPVSATNPVTASISNFPAGFDVNVTGSSVWLSASIVGQPTVTATLVQTGLDVNVTASVTLPVSATNPVTASVSNFPVGFNSNITASITLPVTSTAGSPVWITGTTTTAVSFPAGFDSNITASITLPVSSTNPVTASIANFPAAVTATFSGALVVTSTLAEPVWVTGTTTVAGFPAGFNVNITGSAVTLPVSMTNPVSVTSTTANLLNVRIYDGAGSDLDIFRPADLYTAANDHGLLILGQDAGAPARYRALHMNTAGDVFVTGAVTVNQAATVAVSSTNVVSSTIVGSTVWVSASIVLPAANNADNVVTGTSGYLPVVAQIFGYDDSTGKWNRITADPTNGDAVAAHATPSALDVDAHGRVFNGSTWDRMRGDLTGVFVKVATGTLAGSIQAVNPVTGLVSGTNAVFTVVANVPYRVVATTDGWIRDGGAATNASNPFFAKIPEVWSFTGTSANVLLSASAATGSIFFSRIN